MDSVWRPGSLAVLGPVFSAYTFKHALVQEAAYQTLLKSRRQQIHQRIAHVLTERFPETAEVRPELLAHHCTEAGLIEPAVDYWYRAGQRAQERAANLEAIAHLMRGPLCSRARRISQHASSASSTCRWRWACRR